MSERFNQLIIQTPEGVQFVHQLASPVARFIAVAVDTMAITSLMSVLSVSVTLLGLLSADIAMAFNILLYFVVSIGYYILLEMIWRGQTLGKRLMRLRVIDANGLKLRPSQFVLRNLLRFVDSLPVLYLVGGSCALIHRRSQRLGDLAAGTVVVRVPELHAPQLSEVLGNVYNSFRDHPRLEALLRQRISPEQSAIALHALHRRGEMDAVARARLFAQLAEHFRGQVQFPADVTAAMSDEQYIRNCVDTIYRLAK
ncbi:MULTISPECIES: RDD family protein [unclassified Lentimonas]|uniref:RDD family protein n=1 Tax=unclassified Lentimonas TaxID=2630993 RepID=UPI001327E91F|nr:MULTISPECIES: RDD family protein [unclassified Lentimonas]CAA6694103.1 INTEGRAL MEMBRANE PROTEIN (Rhomboid family) [Lentimonas sp. CC19]CAA6694398.1 INTEGRAL MEMBRANE PROTEIN (Rhomboid family) [Lentimonas sp. CC10]CAA7070336.1 INTEGRAL MEMBRANE PROTEIN (Rhomboid family) [Lentimonas sp. CC11]